MKCYGSPAGLASFRTVGPLCGPSGRREPGLRPSSRRRCDGRGAALGHRVRRAAGRVAFDRVPAHLRPGTFGKKKTNQCLPGNCKSGLWLSVLFNTVKTRHILPDRMAGRRGYYAAMRQLCWGHMGVLSAHAVPSSREGKGKQRSGYWKIWQYFMTAEFLPRNQFQWGCNQSECRSDSGVSQVSETSDQECVTIVFNWSSQRYVCR